ncbi:MAG: ureidoglycolate lyase [Enterobacterales bacterium]|nr:ureidoglycolate lyase [Enterobacterales bacterium]
MKQDIKTVKPKILTQEAFTIYGDVIQVSDKAKVFAINDGFSQRYHDLAKIDLLANQGKVLVNIFRSTPLALPMTIKKMERHPLSSQAFMPLGNEPYLVVVAPAGDFNEDAIEVFLASSDQGVNYHAGTWHHFSLALNQTSDFLVIDRGGEGDNCDLEKLHQPFLIEL